MRKWPQSSLRSEDNSQFSRVAHLKLHLVKVEKASRESNSTCQNRLEWCPNNLRKAPSSSTYLSSTRGTNSVMKTLYWVTSRLALSSLTKTWLEQMRWSLITMAHWNETHSRSLSQLEKSQNTRINLNLGTPSTWRWILKATSQKLQLWAWAVITLTLGVSHQWGMLRRKGLFVALPQLLSQVNILVDQSAKEAMLKHFPTILRATTRSFNRRCLPTNKIVIV